MNTALPVHFPFLFVDRSIIQLTAREYIYIEVGSIGGTAILIMRRMYECPITDYIIFVDNLLFYIFLSRHTYVQYIYKFIVISKLL